MKGRAVADGTWAEFCAIATSEGHNGLLDRVTDAYLEDTPSGGIHILLRVGGGSALGNSKLASDAGGEVLIETRGEGGYAIFAPSNGGVHPTGGAWELVSGGFETIADVTVEERDTLYDIARRLDRKPRPAAASILSTGVATDETAPWDTFTGTCDDVLIAAGFVYHSTTPDHRLGGDARSYTRPGKDPREGSSATVWTDGRCTIFSSSVDTPHEVSDRRRLSPWQLHTHLNFDGDFKAAARDARGLAPISRLERQEPSRHTGIPRLIVPTIGIGQVQAFASDDLLI